MKLTLFIFCCVLHLTYGCIYWIPMSNGSYPQDAVYGGWNDEPLYVARIHVTSNGMAGLISGSLYPKDGIVHAASNGMIVQNSNYEVLAHCIAEWYEGSLLKSFPGQNKVVIAGYSTTGTQLNICRVEHGNQTIIGYTDGPEQFIGGCTITYNGTEYTSQFFEFLVCQNA